MPYTVSITSQGQISIPAQIRTKLGLRLKSKALVSIHENKLIVEPIPNILDMRGSLKTDKKPISTTKLHDQFGQYLAKEAVK